MRNQLRLIKALRSDRSRLWLAIFFSPLLISCNADDSSSDSARFICPFKGNYINSWPFDHQFPFGYFENNSLDSESNVLVHTGELQVMRWGDGRNHNGHDYPMPEGTELFAVDSGDIIFSGLHTPVQW